VAVFEKRKQAKADRVAAAEAAKRSAHIEQLAADARMAHESWEASKLETQTTEVPGVMLKKGEVAFVAIDGAALVEPRRAPGHWAGRSSGYSVHVAKRVNYRIGASKGTYVQGEERPTPTDTGLFVVTNQRCLFMGEKKTTEWAYAKLVGYSLDGEATAFFNVTNRQKTTGVLYTAEVEHLVDPLIAAAIARFQSEEDHAKVVAELAADYRQAYEAWQGEAQQLPAPTPNG
jgi:hypothetical protein